LTDLSHKQVILSALSLQPDFTGLATLPPLSSRHGSALVKWLDRSGLALFFNARLAETGVLGDLPDGWSKALADRQIRNIARTQDMLAEAQRLQLAFESASIVAASLKGFTLTPDFNKSVILRHQVDFDYLIAPHDVWRTAEVLQACGYAAASLNEAGESCFRTPLHHIPTSSDDLYALQCHRQVDLHISLWEPAPWFPLSVPDDSLTFTERREIAGVDFRCVSLEDRFLMQVMHAFRHSFRSWVRVSWILEIATFLHNYRGHSSLWNRVIQRAGNSQLVRSIFAFVLGLAQRLFQAPIPPPLYSWVRSAMTPPLRAWLDHFSFDWVTSDWPGSLSNLLLTSEFIPDPALRRRYWRSRLLPGAAQTSLGVVTSRGTRQRFEHQAARLRYVAHRAGVHLKDIVTLPWRGFRWRRALSSAYRCGSATNC